LHHPPDEERRRSSRGRETVGESESKPLSEQPIPPENQANPFAE
jgi:hypothetical protein